MNQLAVQEKLLANGERKLAIEKERQQLANNQMMITMMQQNFNAFFATLFAASYYPLFARFHTAVAPPQHPIFVLFVATATTNTNTPAAAIEETIDLTHPLFSTPPMHTASNNVMNGTIGAIDLMVPVAASAISDATAPDTTTHCCCYFF